MPRTPLSGPGLRLSALASSSGSAVDNELGRSACVGLSVGWLLGNERDRSACVGVGG